jgi:hypothetical protein
MGRVRLLGEALPFALEHDGKPMDNDVQKTPYQQTQQADGYWEKEGKGIDNA